MDPIINPFTPGAGVPPLEFFGRDDVLKEAEVLFARLKKHRPEKGMLLTGLRGVGKTVLMNKMERLAQEEGFHTIFLEAQEGNWRLGEKLARPLLRMLYDFNRTAGIGNAVKEALMALRNFLGTIKVNCGELGLELAPFPGVADSGSLETDLPELLMSVAEAAQNRGTAVCIFIDEMQNLKEEEVRALIVAMHRMQQKQKPLTLLGSGLPTIPKLAGEALSYAERLFSYPIIGRLSEKSSREALQVTAGKEGGAVTDEAAALVYGHTLGYPYFLQEWGYQMWNYAQEFPIGPAVVQAVTDVVEKRLDVSFFRVRFDRLTENEKTFMRAMADFEESGCKTSELAASLHRTPSQITPVRAQLMRKGMIYSPQHGMLRFSVPMFGDFLRRVMP